MSFAGQVALITGGSRGIGRAVALLLADRGADIALNYRANHPAAAEVVRAIQDRGRRVLPLPADLADGDQIRKIFDAVRREFGHLDILVANAAATAFKPLYHRALSPTISEYWMYLPVDAFESLNVDAKLTPSIGFWG